MLRSDPHAFLYLISAVNSSLAAGAIRPIFFGGELKAQQDREGAQSELIVASNHSAYQNLQAIDEVQRIIKLHAR